MNIKFTACDWDIVREIVNYLENKLLVDFTWTYSTIKTGGGSITLYRLDEGVVSCLCKSFPEILFEKHIKEDRKEYLVKTPLQNALDFLDDVKKTLQEKNKAYGDSAANPLRIFSKSDKDEAIKVRIDDKLSRIAKGDGSGNEDAIKDLVGYLALLAGMRK